MTTCIIAHSTVPSTRISRELALTIGASPSPLTYCRITLVIAVGHSTPPNTLYHNLVVVLCMGMSLQYGSNVCLYLHCYYRWYVVLQAIILCCNTIGLFITNNNQQLKGKDKRSMSFVCPLSLSLLSFPHNSLRLLCLVLFVLGLAGCAQILTSSKKIDNLVYHLSKGSNTAVLKVPNLGATAEPRANQHSFCCLFLILW